MKYSLFLPLVALVIGCAALTPMKGDILVPYFKGVISCPGMNPQVVETFGVSKTGNYYEYNMDGKILLTSGGSGCILFINTSPNPVSISDLLYRTKGASQ